MIKVTRRACPDDLKPSSTKRKKAEKKIHEIVEKGSLPKKKDFTPVWGEQKVRDALHGMQQGRCCYCERFREVNRESDVEHFRPKTEITEERGAGGYWWLAYDWDNLFLSCRYCNQEHKKKFFPIRGTRARKKGADLKAEDAYLIDPAQENPEDHISYDWVTVPRQVIPNGRGNDRERGDRTIEICGLDHPTLNSQRYGILKSLRQLETKMKYAMYLEDTDKIRRIATEIHDVTSAGEPIEFLGFRRWFFHVHLLGEHIAND